MNDGEYWLTLAFLFFFCYTLEKRVHVSYLVKVGEGLQKKEEAE